jgi:hypothetical protein
MALAETDPTRIDDLDDLLDYLTKNLRCTKVVAACVVNQAYLDGELRLEKQDLIRDGEPYGGWIAIDAKFGHLELDRHGRMRVVPGIKLWREARYCIAGQCDARALWPTPSTLMTALPPPPKPITPPKKTKPTTPPKKAKRETQHDRLINLMKERQLKAGMLPRDVRTLIEAAYKTKHRVAVAPSRSAITRAYDECESALTDLRGMPADLSKFYPATPIYEWLNPAVD